MNRIDLLITNARILTLDEADRRYEPGALAILQGRIAALGPAEELRERFVAKSTWDAGGKVILPGLVNTHTHLFQTFMRGLGKDKPLVEWLTHSVRLVMPFLDEEACYLAAMTGCLEAVRSGTTTLLDYMYANLRPDFSDAVAQAFEDLGVRGVLGRGMSDTPEMPWGSRTLTYEPVENALSEMERLRQKYEGHPLIRVCAAPGAVWNMTREGLTAVATYSREYDLPVTMHVLESPIDDEYCQSHYARRTFALLDEIGMLSPKFIAVHGVHLQEEDLRLMRQHGVKFSHNPVSNMILGSGIAPLPEIVASGIPAGLGTDGAASNDSQNMLEVMKITAILHKASRLDASLIPAGQALLMATRIGAEVISLCDQIGSLQAGKCADLVVIDLEQPNTTPSFDPVASLVYSGNPSNIDSVMVHGRFILEHGQIVTQAEPEVLRRAACKARQLLEQSQG